MAIPILRAATLGLRSIAAILEIQRIIAITDGRDAWVSGLAIGRLVKRCVHIFAALRIQIIDIDACVGIGLAIFADTIQTIVTMSVDIAATIHKGVLTFPCVVTGIERTKESIVALAKMGAVVTHMVDAILAGATFEIVVTTFLKGLTILTRVGHAGFV